MECGRERTVTAAASASPESPTGRDPHLRAVLAASLMLATSGCAGAAPEARLEPEGTTSAAAHRREARAQVQSAGVHRGLYDERATVEQHVPVGTTDPGRAGVRLYPDDLYEPSMWSPTADTNPTEPHLDRSAEHEALAGEHYRAALQIERFEAQECAGVAREDRAACPLLDRELRALPIELGYRLILPERSGRSGFVSRMRCHHAFARSEGFHRMPNCPLYLSGLRVEDGPEGAIDLTVRDGSELPELRRRLQAHHVVLGGSTAQRGL